MPISRVQFELMARVSKVATRAIGGLCAGGMTFSTCVSYPTWTALGPRNGTNAFRSEGPIAKNVFPPLFAIATATGLISFTIARMYYNARARYAPFIYPGTATGVNMWALGAVLFGIAIPYTFYYIKSTYKALLDSQLDTREEQEARGLLRLWAHKNVIRTVLAVSGFLAFLIAD